jgi:hypothetical protein
MRYDVVDNLWIIIHIIHTHLGESGKVPKKA